MWGFGKCVGCAAFGEGLVGEWKLPWGIFCGVCWRGQYVILHKCNSLRIKNQTFLETQKK